MILIVSIKNTSLFEVLLENLYLKDKEYVSKEIIKCLRLNNRLFNFRLKVKRSYIIKLAKLTSITIHNEKKYRILKGNEIVDFCINWPKFYIENHGNIFNRF